MITIKIQKTYQVAFVQGGEYGPGQTNSDGGVLFNWNLPVDQLEKDSTKQTLVTQTLGNVMDVIGASAIIAVGSYCSGGSAGDYTDPLLSLSITNTPDATQGGQIQIIGNYIDLRNVNDPNFADLAALPTGSFAATPISGSTSRNVMLIIED